jgi:hypothetical protein
MAKKQIDTGTILAIGAGVAVIWGLTGLKKLLNQLGITESQETRDVDREQSNPFSPWSPQFYEKAPSGAKLLTTSQATQLFDAIDSSWGYFDDDEEKIKGSIKNFIKTQSQWSFFAWWMARNKSIDLFDYMRGSAYWGRLEDSDMAEITDYIKSLPKYK